MKLQCPVIREGGSVVDLFGTDYHFLPQPDGFHVADVENVAHQDHLLSIGYRIYRGITAQQDLISNPEKPKSEPEIIDFSDLKKIDALSLSNEDLERFAAEIMGVSIKRKSFINDWFQKHFTGKDPIDDSLTIIEMVRFCATLIVEAEKAAS